MLVFSVLAGLALVPVCICTFLRCKWLADRTAWEVQEQSKDTNEVRKNPHLRRWDGLSEVDKYLRRF